MPDLAPIEAQERSIGQVLSDDYAFEIPPYQRPYAWEEENARELLSDLLEAMDRGGKDEVYFLGSIVLIKKPGLPEAKVVDGQQRLTTLTILLSVMRDLTSDPETRYERRTYVCQKASADKGTTDRFRLLLRERDRPFFQTYVQEMGGSEKPVDMKALEGSQARIAENRAFFRKRLSALEEKRRNDLFAFAIQRCFLVVVAVSTPGAARRIFTVLNARGMDLTATDMLKAELLDQLPDKEGSLARRWDAVELSLGRDRFVELFGHMRMLFEREKPRTSLESGFAKAVPFFSSEAERFIGEILEPIAAASELLTKNVKFQSQFGAFAAKAARSLNRIDNKDWVPAALVRLWKRKPEDAGDVAKLSN